MTEKKKILIYGAGSIGVFLGSVLLANGHEVTLFGRRKLQRLHDSILINGALYKTPQRIYELPQDTWYDFIFVTTKLYDSENALKQIEGNGLRYETLVLIQNGLVDDSLFASYKKHPSFVTMSVFEGYHLIENQLLATKSSMGWKIEDSEAGGRVHELLNSVGVNCNAVSNLDSVRAEKMILVNAVGALSAMEKKTLGELVSDQKTKNIIESLIDETYAVLHDEYELASLEEIKKRFYETISQVKRHYSSMYQDVLSNRSTEIEYLNGFIVRLGEKKGIVTSVNEEIYHRFKSLNF